jgi:hypothetical protein
VLLTISTRHQPATDLGYLLHKNPANAQRFEWMRAEFQAWAKLLGEQFWYSMRFLAVGDDDPMVGSPTQMEVLELGAHSNA